MAIGGTYKYSDVTQKLDDELRDITTSALDNAKKYRVIKTALDTINVGLVKVSGFLDGQMGYDFQKDVVTFTFTNGTESYTFTALGITEREYKFFWALRINSTENQEFDYVDNNYFTDQASRRGIQRNMIADDFWDRGVRKIKVNHFTTGSLDLEYVASYLTVSSNGTTLKDYPDSESDSDATFLIPDRFIMTLVNLAAVDALKMFKDIDRTTEILYFQNEANMWLEKLVAAHGIKQRKPIKRIKIRPEMGSRQFRISRR
jgi:hypothetical protein